ncbi:MAG: sigma factor-like helix-turn-helix DNA-binding protein, partial [Planctomycetota bacterium]
AEPRELVLDGIELLAEIYREPLRMHFLFGLEAHEVARELRQNLHTIKSRLARGRRELRRRLEPRLTKAGYL